MPSGRCSAATARASCSAVRGSARPLVAPSLAADQPPRQLDQEVVLVLRERRCPPAPACARRAQPGRDRHPHGHRAAPAAAPAQRDPHRHGRAGAHATAGRARRPARRRSKPRVGGDADRRRRGCAAAARSKLVDERGGLGDVGERVEAVEVGVAEADRPAQLAHAEARADRQRAPARASRAAGRSRSRRPAARSGRCRRRGRARARRRAASRASPAGRCRAGAARHAQRDRGRAGADACPAIAEKVSLVTRRAGGRRTR